MGYKFIVQKPPPFAGVFLLPRVAVLLCIVELIYCYPWNVDNNDINLLIRVTDIMNTKKCLKYWKQVTKLPLQNIHININNKQNKSKTKYGVCRVTIKKGGYGLKVTHAIINEIVARMETI